MITPRQTRLFRAPTLAAFRTILADWLYALTPAAARDTFVIVPTQAAAEQLRRSVEDRLGVPPAPAALAWPLVGTRATLYEQLASRSGLQPRLSAFEREVMLSSAAHAVAAAGVAAPFGLRPGLVAEMLALYDHIRRLGRTVDDFERNFRDELIRDQDADRGATQLLQQTEFLAATYRAYETRVLDSGRADEHVLRAALAATDPAAPLRRVVVTVADRIADGNGLWPADFALLTQLPALDTIDVLGTEAVIAAGFLERLHAAFPEIADATGRFDSSSLPTLVTPRQPPSATTPSSCFAYRDREDELMAVARRLKIEERARPGHLSRKALVVSRPLPYLYLARAVFGDTGIPFETLDTLPLAAEPYAAALDLVLDAVWTDFTRSALTQLLRSPHFRLFAPAPQPAPDDPDRLPIGEPSEPANGATRDAAADASIAALDFALADARFLGGLDRLEHLAAAWSAITVPASRMERRRVTAAPAARAAADLARQLAPLAATRPVIDQIATLLAWLRRFDAGPPAEGDAASRAARVRAAVIGALTALGDAYRRHDPDARADVAWLTGAIRRWLGSQTIADPTGEPGLQVVDAAAARYGEFDDIQIVGLVEGDWPDRARRNVLYPTSLLALLEPLPAVADPGRRERDGLNAARAAFRDLLQSARSQVRLSTFTLDNDAVVEPSILLDDVESQGLPRVVADEPAGRVARSEALALEPRTAQTLPAGARQWAAARLQDIPTGLAAGGSAPGMPPDRFRGAAGPWILPRISVSRLERYLGCPFRFFAAEVLRLEEQPEDEDAQTPLERGLFLHELWERFFTEWQARGYGRVTPEALPDARALFVDLCEDALATLPASDAGLERVRLLGSAVNPGIAHRVFAMEANRPVRIVERLLEFALQGEFTFRARDGRTRTLALGGKVDRLDLLEDGTVRVIDYKSKYTPDLKDALQLPIYGMCARERLSGRRGRTWTLQEALYLSFEGPRAEKPLKARGRTLDDLVDDAQDRLLQVLDDIAAGTFPPRPAKKSLCTTCSYREVCRLDIVDEDREASS